MSDYDRILRLIDQATDPGHADDVDVDAAIYDGTPRDQLQIRLLQQIAAALGAITLLIVRHDELVWDAWKRY